MCAPSTASCLLSPPSPTSLLLLFAVGQTAHTAIIHCAATVVVCLASVLVHRGHQAKLRLGFLSFVRSVSGLGFVPVAMTCLVNAVLLVLLAVSQDFLHGTDRLDDKELSSHALLAMQLVAVGEAVVCVVAGTVYLYRVRRHNVAQPLPDARKLASLNTYNPPGGGGGGPNGGGGSALDNTMMSVASHNTYSQQRANEVIAYLQQREDDLVFQVDNLTQQLEAQLARPVSDGSGDVESGAGSGGGGHRPSGGSGPSRTTSANTGSDAAEHVQDLTAQLHAATEQVEWQKQELRKVNAEVQRLRAALRAEQSRTEKLQLTLEIEKEANAQAQRVIEGIRNLDASDLSDAGARTSDFGAGYSPPAPSYMPGRPPRRGGSGGL